MPEPDRRQPPIREGHAPMPWWGWVLIACLLIYAFVLGPFDWLS